MVDAAIEGETQRELTMDRAYIDIDVDIDIEPSYSAEQIGLQRV
jgi:hypothetical protein